MSFQEVYSRQMTFKNGTKQKPESIEREREREITVKTTIDIHHDMCTALYFSNKIIVI